MRPTKGEIRNTPASAQAWACTWLKQRLNYDDSLDVFGIHGVGGVLGTLATGIFAVGALSATTANPAGLPGLLEGNAKAPKKAKPSSPREPNTIHCLDARFPSTSTPSLFGVNAP